MTLRMIAAVSRQGVIGRDNGIPWFHKGDLKFFKEKTENQVVIMGRKTWESLPPKMRPLPSRVNMVVASTCPWPDRTEGSSVDLWWAPSMDSLVGTARELFPLKDIWFIGGAGVYRAALALAEEAIISEVPDTFDLNVGVYVFWPDLGSDFSLVSREPHPYSPELTLAIWRREFIDEPCPIVG